MTGGQPISLDFRIVLKDSSIRHVQATSEISDRDSNGKPVIYIGTTQDITDSKQAEQELRETRDYLDSLFNYANALSSSGMLSLRLLV